MTLTLPARHTSSEAHRSAVGGSAADQRPRLQAELAAYDQLAREAAAAGDIASSARSILAVLNCERRLAGVGPQVLQLIKPRS